MKKLSATSHQLSAVLRVAVLIGALLLGWRAWRIEGVIEQEAREVRPAAERAIAEQGERTRAMVAGVAANLTRRLDGQVSALRADLKAESAAYRSTADARLAAIQGDLNGRMGELVAVADRQLGQANGSVARLATFADLQPLAANLLGDFGKTSKLMFDCQASPRTCVAPRVAGTLRAVELSAGDFSKAMKFAPVMVETAQKTNGHVERYVEWWTRPKSVLGHVKDVGLTVAGFGWRFR